MPRSILLIILMILTLFQHSTLGAQNGLPSVIEPEEILVTASSLSERLPIIIADDTAQTLFYFDPAAKQWSSFAYPDALDEIGDTRYFIRARSNGTYLINPGGFWGFSQNRADRVWIFDPFEGSFSRPEAACGLARDLSGEGKWVIVEDSETGSSRLCFTETGQLSPPVPVQNPDSWCPPQWLHKPVVTSPDNKWVLMFCGGLAFTAYSYHIETETFQFLGRSEPRLNENVDVVRWPRGTTAIIHAYPSWNPPANTYYVTDVAQAGSLEFITWDLYAAPFYFNEPLHLEWMPCEFGGCGGEPLQGGLRYYDFSERQLIVFPEIEGIHGISNVIPDSTGDRLYRSLNYADDLFFRHGAPSATLIRFSYTTGERHELFTGEVEWVDSFSPTGRYAVLYMGNDNVVFDSFVLAENQAGYSPDGYAEIAIFDLKTNAIIFQATGNPWEPYGYNPFNLFTPGYNPLPVTWLSADTFFIQGVNGDEHQVIQLDERVHVLVSFENPIYSKLSPDKRRILLRDYSIGIAVYDIAADTMMPIIQPAAFEQYELDVEWQNADSLSIIITAQDTTDILADWCVSLPSS